MPPTWNTAHARTLYDQGYSFAAIAVAVGVPRQTVRSYAKSHEWPGHWTIRRRKAGAAPAAPTTPRKDDDVSLYRAEKAARVKLGPADDFAEARLILIRLEADAKPKRGRPKQSIGRAEHARKVA